MKPSKSRIASKFAILLAALTIVIVIGGCAPSELDRANELYDQGDYKGALEIYKTQGATDEINEFDSQPV